MEKGKLLIVDDEPDFLRMLADRFSARGYEVIWALDGETALNLVERERPDLVLLDIHMPRLDGVDLLREIRTAEPNLGVIIQTGDASNDLGKMLLAEGACDYVVKPIDFPYLEDSVWANMQLSRGQSPPVSS